MVEAEQELKLKVAASIQDDVNKGIVRVDSNFMRNIDVRPGDIVGAICNIEGLSQNDIGIIDVQESVSYVDILNGKGNKVINELKNMTIKGKRLNVQKANK